MPSIPTDTTSTRALYARLEQKRQPFLKKAQRCAELTIPAIFPPDGTTGSTDFPTPYAGVGARGVNNLASKLLLALLPPNSPFFRLVVDPFALKKLGDDSKVKTALEKTLGEIERAVGSEVETSAVRISIFEALKQTLIGGNALLYIPVSGGVRVFNLERYVIQRDPMGHVLRIITKESVNPALLPEAVRTLAERNQPPLKEGEMRVVDVYTSIRRTKLGAPWEVWQEVGDSRIPESAGSYPEDKCPWVPLRYSKIDGEDYGRGLCEELLGDLSSLEALEKSLLEANAAMARIIFLVNPASTVKATQLAKLPNGGFASGTKDDVHCLQVDKYYDLRSLREHIATKQRDLELSFMLNTGATRQAERVTAEEIRAVVQELESTLGGVYSILAQELQLPLVTALMDRMARDGRLPRLPKKVVKPAIVTGLDALGRGNDLQKLDLFLRGLQETLGADTVSSFINVPDYLTRRATALGIDLGALIKTPEQIAQDQQQAQLQHLAENLGPNAITQLGQMVQQQQAGNAAPVQQ